MTTKLHSMPKGRVTLPNSATDFAFDGSIANIFQCTLLGNAAITFSNLKEGETYCLVIVQGGGGGWTPTFSNATLPASQQPFVVAQANGASTTMLFMCILASGGAFGIAMQSVGVTPSNGQVFSAGNLVLECGAASSIVLQEDGAEARALSMTDSDPFGLGAGPTLSTLGACSIIATGTCQLKSSATRLIDPGNVTQINVTNGSTAIGSSSADVCNIQATIGTGVAYKLPLSNKTQVTVGAAGGAAALPATPSGYINFTINGTERVIPYYAQA